MARRHRNCAMGFIWMDVPLWWWARTPISPPIPVFCRGGTAYQSDAGMCGDYNSVIDAKEAAIGRFSGGWLAVLAVATGTPSLCGVFLG